jgi:DnaJ-class molecular chaperone
MKTKTCPGCEGRGFWAYYISEDDFETECCPECGGSGYVEGENE